MNHDRPKEALVKIKKLKTFEPGLAQLSKIAADAALATRDLDSAQEFIDELFNSRQSLSDALVFQAWLETRRIADQNYTRFGDPKLRIEASLRQAMAADPTNPRPYVELAGLLRALKRPEEALQFLKSAQLRQSVDLDTIVVDVSLALLELQMMSDSELSQIPVKSGSDTQSLLAEVYRAMRLGDSSKAISRLEQARQSTPEKIFSKLLKDPAFVVYSRDPAYGDFFKK
ncbi:MAG: tetratricopeptide repeat protein [bacterium]